MKELKTRRSIYMVLYVFCALFSIVFSGVGGAIGLYMALIFVFLGAILELSFRNYSRSVQERETLIAQNDELDRKMGQLLIRKDVGFKRDSEAVGQ